MSGLPKLCGCCGRSHGTPAAWRLLPVAGEDGLLDDGEELLELRNCPCGSTLAIVLGDSPSRDTVPAPCEAA